MPLLGHTTLASHFSMARRLYTGARSVPMAFFCARPCRVATQSNTSRSVWMPLLGQSLPCSTLHWQCFMGTAVREGETDPENYEDQAITIPDSLVISGGPVQASSSPHAPAALAPQGPTSAEMGA